MNISNSSNCSFSFLGLTRLTKRCNWDISVTPREASTFKNPEKDKYKFVNCTSTPQPAFLFQGWSTGPCQTELWWSFYNFDLKSLTLIKLALQRRNEEVGQYNCSVCCMSFVTLRELEVNSLSGAIFDVYETKSFYVRQSRSHIFLSMSRCLIYLGSLFKFSCAYFVHNDFI